MKLRPEIDGLSVVLAGNFNPRIFTPDWFVRQNLLSSSHLNDKSIEVIHPDICKFETDWCSFSVSKDHFQIGSQVGPLIRVIDLAAKTFGEFLPHTPVVAVGINRSVHFQVESEEVLNRIGTTLAPHDPWGEWGEMFTKQGDARGGLVNIEMLENKPEDRDDGYVKCTVRPSELVKPYGVFVGINDHYRFSDVVDGRAAAGLISAVHEGSSSRSLTVIDSVMALAEYSI